MKKLILSFLILAGVGVNAHAVTNLISKSTFTVQQATISVPLGRIDDLRVSTLTVSGSQTFNTLTVGTLTVTGGALVPLADIATEAARFGQTSLIGYAMAGHNTSSSTTSTSYVLTNLQVTYTPKRADSTIVIIANSSLFHSANGFSGLATIFRDATNIAQGDTNNALACARGNGATDNLSMGVMIKGDSAGSTTSRVYRVGIKTLSGGGTTAWGQEATQFMLVLEFNALN